MYVGRVPPDPLTRALRGAYDRSADEYDARFRALQAVKYDAMLRAAGAALATRLRQGRVLDLGCGTGLFVEHLAATGHAAVRCVGLDVSYRMARRARERGAIAVHADAAALPFAAASFDAVLAFTVLEIWPDAGQSARVLREVGRVLTPDGMLVVTVLAAAAQAGFAARLTAAGFSGERVGDCGQDVGYVCRRVFNAE